MTTFTTEDRILAEKDGSLTFNVEPIPFAGLVTLTEPKYKNLTDEEIEGIARANVDGHSSMEQLKWFARAILRKAQE
jgi:hypothetical protein